MSLPLVSIITPSYNQGHFIRDCIESVLNQDYPRVEYIIMDGGSTDNTASVIKAYSNRLTWISEKDRGQSHAINKGFRMAKGEIVSWINSDDIILPGAVSKAVQTLVSHPDAGAVYGEGYQIDVNGNFKGRFFATEPFNLWKLVYLYDYILQQTVFFRKCVVEEVGCLDENLHWGLDWDLLIRIGKKYSIEYLPEYMGAIREYDEAKSFSGGTKRFRELAQILRRHGDQRFPPGYLYYGLGTYRAIWCSKIERWTPPFLQRPSARLQQFILSAAGYWISRTARESQGWYADGWATTRVKYMFTPVRDKNVVIRGTLPPLNGLMSKQTVRVRIGKDVVAEKSFGPGDFTINVDLPSDVRTQVVNLTLEASRSFIPALHRMGRDFRRLCYILKEIVLSDPPASAGLPRSTSDEEIRS